MKKNRLLVYCLFVCLMNYSIYASYTYEVYTYGGNETLYSEETILVDLQGGMDGLTLYNNSSADIRGTSTLGQGTGGIWTIQLAGNSYLDMSDGQVHEIAIANDATAFLSGGLIQQIWSSQNAWAYDNGDPPVLVPDPHITIECLDHIHNPSSNMLTGHWLDHTAFSIQLIDVLGYSPAIENIQFVPEPTTLALLSLGGLFLRRKI